MPRIGSAIGPLCLAAIGFAGCTNILGIDNEYVLENSQTGSGGAVSSGGETSASGGEGEGGTASSGGDVSTGGRVGTGGVPANTDAGPECVENGDCETGKKCCGGTCVSPQPLTGCGMTGCQRCEIDIPQNGLASCVSGACGVTCVANYQLVDGKCEPIASGTGGASGGGGATATGGKTGTGGAPPACVAKNCPGCPGIGPFGCCKFDNMCGCTWAPGAACY